MRAGVLSKNSIIELLNEHFINTWVFNADLGRSYSLKEPIANRYRSEGKSFDTTNPLAQAIIKGWKTGSKKGSPVDSFVISPEFELMGKQQIHKLERGINQEKAYYKFLKNALAGKEPGLGNIVLSREKPSHIVLDVFKTPVTGYADFTVIVIDATAFENGGTLTIEIETGRSDAEGYFYLVDEDDDLPTTEFVTKDMVLARAWLEPEEATQLEYTFAQGQLFKFGATGCNFSNEKGNTNAFKASISVAEN